MKKLQEGDYVRNLTEEQFNELLMIETGRVSLTYSITLSERTGCYKQSLRFDEDGDLMHGWKSLCKNELTFEEFKQRAINTYNND